MTKTNNLNRKSTFLAKFAEALTPAIESELANIENKYDWSFNFTLTKEKLTPYNYIHINRLLDKVEKFAENNNIAKTTIYFKKSFSEVWKNSDISMPERTELVKLVVAYWGGIYTNSEETLKDYASKLTVIPNPEELNKLSNSSSFTKIISFIDPDKYFIYDSRVAMYLCNELINNTEFLEYGYIFSLSGGRSNDFKAFEDVYDKVKATIPNAITLAYTDYCELIYNIWNNIKNKPNNGIQLVEMTLFQLGHNIDLER